MTGVPSMMRNARLRGEGRRYILEHCEPRGMVALSMMRLVGARRVAQISAARVVGASGCAMPWFAI